MALKYRPLRQRRINRLLQYGFTKQEAINLTKMKTTYPSGEVRYSSIILGRPYIKRMMRNRLLLVRQAVKDGMKAKDIREMISKEYSSNGWLKDDGTFDYWKMFRYWYRQSVQLGDYKPPPRKYDPDKPHKKLGEGGVIDREHVKRQAAKYRERDSEAKSRGYVTTQRTGEGELVGGIIYNKETGRYEARYEK